MRHRSMQLRTPFEISYGATGTMAPSWSAGSNAYARCCICRQSVRATAKQTPAGILTSAHVHMVGLAAENVSIIRFGGCIGSGPAVLWREAYCSVLGQVNPA